MTSESKTNRDKTEKLHLFGERFSGLEEVYGTYDLFTGRSYQVKEPVTTTVFMAHLLGRKPYGVYLLTGSVTRAIVADFDVDDPSAALEFIAAAKHYGIACYLERSKAKGYHVWGFANRSGISSAKGRAVFQRILDEIDKPKTELFPKQNHIPSNSNSYGNFINVPLFGKLVPQGRTVFLNVTDGLLRPYPDQWTFLENVSLIEESLLDEIIEVNEIPVGLGSIPERNHSLGVFMALPGTLPPCVRQMLEEGVTTNQRVSCFRLAVHLRKVGLPFDLAKATLLEWSRKNRPTDDTQIITPAEVRAQTSGAYSHKEYRGCGCEDAAMKPFCSPLCPVFQSANNTQE